MTGLSGAGKSTLAKALKDRLTAQRCLATVLDGDVLRSGLNAGLGFSSADRQENIRRTAQVASLMLDAGFVVICALISPEAAQRELARAIVGDRFFEIHVNSSLAVCESRDPKGLYARARQGELQQFTGISAPYEAPVAPDVAIDTAHSTIEQSVAKLHAFVLERIRPLRIER
jgi:adenylyl-sulfate kinase